MDFNGTFTPEQLQQVEYEANEAVVRNLPIVVSYPSREELDQLDIKIFRFEKRDCCYEQLTEEEKAEERSNILNGLNFARKVVVTQECDFLLLDEILGLLDRGIVTVDAIIDILKQKDESMHIVMTGWNFPEELKPYVDTITTLNSEEVHHSCEQQ